MPGRTRANSTAIGEGKAEPTDGRGGVRCDDDTLGDGACCTGWLKGGEVVNGGAVTGIAAVQRLGCEAVGSSVTSGGENWSFESPLTSVSEVARGDGVWAGPFLIGRFEFDRDPERTGRTAGTHRKRKKEEKLEMEQKKRKRE